MLLLDLALSVGSCCHSSRSEFHDRFVVIVVTAVAGVVGLWLLLVAAVVVIVVAVIVAL